MILAQAQTARTAQTAQTDLMCSESRGKSQKVGLRHATLAMRVALHQTCRTTMRLGKGKICIHGCCFLLCQRLCHRLQVVQGLGCSYGSNRQVGPQRQGPEARMIQIHLKTVWLEFGLSGLLMMSICMACAVVQLSCDVTVASAGEDWHRCCSFRVLHCGEEALRLGLQESKQPSRCLKH